MDFGGTKILTGAITKEGKIIGEPVKFPTNGNDSAEKIFSRLTDSIKGVMEQIDSDKFEVAGIGLGVTGPIDIRNGIILECPQLPTMNFYPLREKDKRDISFSGIHE